MYYVYENLACIISYLNNLAADVAVILTEFHFFCELAERVWGFFFVWSIRVLDADCLYSAVFGVFDDELFRSSLSGLPCDVTISPQNFFQG